jgi:hypothetical protein
MIKLIATTLIVIALGLVPIGAKVEPADIVFENGNIYTVNDSLPHAQAVAVKGDRIL